MSAHHRLAVAFTAAVLLGLNTAAHGAGANAEWQKVKEAIESAKQPKVKPKSREELIANLKQSIEVFDAAYPAALAVAPKDPARWEAALFEQQVAPMRKAVGLPEQTKPTIPLEDVLQAEDAPQEVKADASAILVLRSADEAEASGRDTNAWIAKAEKHLKDYPDGKMNKRIESKVTALKSTAALKTKPLDLKFTAIDGRKVDLAELRGKVVLIDFWATWCGPCVHELPNVLSAYQDLHPKGFEIVGISLDEDKGKVESFVKEKGMEWPQFFDGKGWKNEISSRFEIHSIPAMWLVNKQGMLVSTNARGTLKDTVTELLSK